MTGWRGELEGWHDELQALARMFGSERSGMHVTKQDRTYHDSTYYLDGHRLEVCNDRAEAWNLAELLVTRLNVAGLVKFGSFRPVSLRRILDSSGSGFAVNTATVALPSQSLQTYVQQPPSAPITLEAREALERLLPVEDWLGAADVWQDIDVVARMLVQAPSDWRQLYYVHEVIMEDAANRQATKVAALGWATREEIRRFRHTANSRRALGEAARHGERTTLPPAKPMTLLEAQELVQRLVARWFEWKTLRVGHNTGTISESGNP